jgi:ATP-dependent Lon protease
MRDFRDAKAMARTLRDALSAKSVSLTHSESLELIARVLGFHDWNVLGAKIDSEHQVPIAQSSAKSRMVGPETAGSSVLGSVPVLPMRDLVLFPKKMIVPIFVGRDTTKRAVETAMAKDKRIIAVAQRRSGDDAPTPDALYGVGVTATVIDVEAINEGAIRLVVKSLERAAIARWERIDPFLSADIDPIQETRGQEEEAFALARAALEKVKMVPNVKFPFARFERIDSDPSVVADAIASFLSLNIEQKQDILETNDVIARLGKIHSLLKVDQQAT